MLSSNTFTQYKDENVSCIQSCFFFEIAAEAESIPLPGLKDMTDTSH